MIRLAEHLNMRSSHCLNRICFACEVVECDFIRLNLSSETFYSMYILASLKVTWVDFSIVANAICIHNVLKARGELVGLVVGGWGLFGLHPVQDGGHSGATFLLESKKKKRSAQSQSHNFTTRGFKARLETDCIKQDSTV